MGDQFPLYKRRILLWLGVLAIVLICGLVLWVLLMNILVATGPDIPIAEIEHEGTQYILTCKATMDGPVDLFLYACEDSFDESCEAVRESGTMGHNCKDEIILRVDSNRVEAIDPNATVWNVLLSYELDSVE
jgi:hypothetical protein